MTEDIKALIDKIYQEGVKSAKDKARDIENEAKRAGEDIIAKAKIEAEKLVATAYEEAARLQQNTDALLKQAGRDLLISLKKEINAMLERLLLERVRSSLNPEEVARLITLLIKEYSAKGKTEALVLLKKEDCQSLEKHFLSELKEKIGKGITLRPSDDIQAGFIISYDAGKSYYDFSDKALADYLGLYIKPQLEKIFQSV
jgi:V/A-type H+-transporting ATPase subunit E